MGATEPTARRCALCGASLEGRRPQCRWCSDGCRTEGSRLARLLAGRPVDGYQALGDRVGRLRASPPLKTEHKTPGAGVG
jgi:hypothetical protein